MSPTSLDTQEFLAGYLAEAHEHLASATANLLALDAALKKGQQHPRAVRELFRALHTLKGLSAMIGAEPIVDVAHEMEALLRSADRAGGRLDPGAVDVLLQGVRAIEARVASLRAGQPLAAAPQALLHALTSITRPAGQGAQGGLTLAPELDAKLSTSDREELLKGLGEGRRARRVDFIPSPERAAAGLNITSVRERVAAVADIVKVLPRTATAADGAPAGVAFVLLVLTEASDERLAEAAGTQPAAVQPIERAVPPAASGAAEPDAEPEEGPPEVAGAGPAFVRVEVSRLDEALDRLAAMVVTRARLERATAALGERGADVRELRGILQEHARELRDLRAAVTRARLVRVSALLERAPLIVRGLSQSSGKAVRLVVRAGDAELDKSVADRLFPVIVHLLRNAVDHAIEPVEERRRAGKPDEGQITISAAELSRTELELTVEDDGHGIDRDAVARRAGAAPPQDDAALLDLIARPGFTTLDHATRTSGRGVGMDVVRRVVADELGGELVLATRPGEGTRFTLRVPLSLTIVDAFTFSAAGTTFAVPVGAVEDLVEVDERDVVQSPDPRGRHARLLRRRGAALPLLRLDDVLDAPRTPAGRPKAIVVRRDGEALAFQVDRMLGQQEVVVRPVPDPLVAVPGIAGTTDLGDGRPTLVLDLSALVRAAPARAEAR